jgi:hypothetical protein
MRSRLLQRIHLAMLRGANAKGSTDTNEQSFVGVNETDKYEDPDGLLTATSIRMSLAIMQCLAPTSLFPSSLLCSLSLTLDMQIRPCSLPCPPQLWNCLNGHLLLHSHQLNQLPHKLKA